MSRRRLAAVLVSAAVVIAAIGGYVLLTKHVPPNPLTSNPPGQSPRPPPSPAPSPPGNTTTTNTTGPGGDNAVIANNTSRTATNPGNGLELNVTIYQAIVPMNNSTSIQILIVNPTGTTKNVSSANDYPLNLTGPPCYEDRPFGYAIYQGILNLSDIINNPSEYTPLQLNYPTNYSCGNQSQQPYWVFYPYGQFVDTAGFSGYYANYSGSPTFTHFQPGKYTIVVGDEWGQTVALYFEVY